VIPAADASGTDLFTPTLVLKFDFAPVFIIEVPSIFLFPPEVC